MPYSVPATKIIYDTKRKVGANGGGRHGDVTLMDFVSAVNEALEIWFSSMVEAAEVNPAARAEIDVYEEKLIPLTLQGSRDGITRADLPDDLYRRLNQRAVATRPSCCGDIKKNIIIRIPGSDDINEAIGNPYRRADFFFEQLFGSQSAGQLFVYDQGEMIIESVIIDYYRLPAPLHAPSLVKCKEDSGKYYLYDGQAVTKDTQFAAANRQADRKISDIAALLIAREERDYNAFQAHLQSILAISKLN